MKKKVAIVGFGKLGKAYYDIIKRSNLFEVVAVYDKEELNLARVEVFDDIATMFSNISVDTVILSSNTYPDKELLLKYMKYVKNVYVELDFFQDKEILDEVMKYKKNNALNVVVAFHDRYNPVILSLSRELAKEQEIKSINIIRGDESQNTDESHFRDNLFKNLDLIHFLGKSKIKDYLYFNNEEDGKVTCKSSLLKTENNILVTSLSSTVYFSDKLNLEILTNSAVFFADLINLTLYKISDKGKINLKVDNEFMNLKYEHDDFYELCKSGNFKNLVQIEELLEYWENILWKKLFFF